MLIDCHIHMVLDAVDWKTAIARHSTSPDEAYIRNVLTRYRDLGYTYLRDCGDRWGVGYRARELAPEYGITYRTPLAPLSMAGHYGGFIGLTYDSLNEFARLVKQQKQQGADFVKIMISGLMDFHHYGVLTEDGLSGDTIRQLIHIAHEEGLSVSAHANGAQTILAAAEAGVDSVEHGAYQNPESLAALAESGTVWVPTLSTIGNLRGKQRFPETAVCAILSSSLQSLADYRGFVALGTDAGAWSVPHGVDTEMDLMQLAGISNHRITEGNTRILDKF